jgi:hypothetical protein
MTLQSTVDLHSVTLAVLAVALLIHLLFGGHRKGGEGR